MSRTLRVLLLVELIVCVILGLLLLIVPGRVLLTIGWEPVDPIISRILGAGLLSAAWGHWRLRRAGASAAIRVWAEVQASFAALAAMGVLRHLVMGRWPAMVWILFAVLVLSSAAWLWVLIKELRPA